jgi:CubicO group peptidase (beta-lactamase class C family)
MKKIYSVSVLLICTAIAFIPGCKTDQAIYKVPAPDYWPTSGWQTSTPEKQGMDSEKITDLIEFIQVNAIPVHSLHIVRNGYLITEVYFYPYDGSTVHDIASITKSITSILIGAAINKGLIKDEYVSVKGFFPEYDSLFHDPYKVQMTIKDLVTMTSGLELINNDSTSSVFAEATLFNMFNKNDWLQYILKLPAVYRPGLHFGYNSCNFHLLSIIMSRATHMKMADFARDQVFEPLGIRDFIWPEDSQGHNHGWGDLKLRPRDMAKIGFLLLHNGTWDDQQILDPEWVKKSAQRQADVPGPPGDIHIDYSYGWWVISGSISGIYEANGRGGQHIIIWPQQNLVVVLTGGGFDQGEIAEHLIATVNQPGTRPDNKEAYHNLQDVIKWVGEEPPGLAMVYTSPLVRTISDKPIILETNPLGLSRISIKYIDPVYSELKIQKNGIETVTPIRMGIVYAISQPDDDGLPIGTRGIWMNDTTLSIEINEIANINDYKISVIFSDNTVVLSVYEPNLFTKPIIIKGNF